MDLLSGPNQINADIDRQLASLPAAQPQKPVMMAPPQQPQPVMLPQPGYQQYPSGGYAMAAPYQQAAYQQQQPAYQQYPSGGYAMAAAPYRQPAYQQQQPQPYQQQQQQPRQPAYQQQPQQLPYQQQPQPYQQQQQQQPVVHQQQHQQLPFQQPQQQQQGAVPQQQQPFQQPQQQPAVAQLREASFTPADPFFGGAPAPAAASSSSSSSQQQQQQQQQPAASEAADDLLGFFDSAPASSTTRVKDEDEGDSEKLEVQATAADAVESYEVTFHNEVKLGMLLERRTDLVDNKAVTGQTLEKKKGPEGDAAAPSSSETTVVTMVIEGGAAALKGVVVGSRLVEINGADARSLPYARCLEMVKSNPRPLRLTFERSKASCDTAKGDCLVRKTAGSAPPSRFDQWKPCYFVVGGAVAKKHVLQFYESKAQYEHVVVCMFQGKPIANVTYKAYALTSAFKISGISAKNYKVPGGDYKTIKYFTLRNPHSRTKTMKLAAENPSVLHALHSHCLRFCSQGSAS